MRHVSRMFGAAVLAGVIAFTGATPAAVASIDDGDFQVTLRTVSDHYDDVGRPGPSVGDTFTFRDRVFHRGNQVGHDNGRCDVTRSTRGLFTFHCVVTLSLRGRGQIAVQGPLTFRRGGLPRGTLVVTGGTRKYADATGSARIIELRGEPTRLRVNLRG